MTPASRMAAVLVLLLLAGGDLLAFGSAWLDYRQYLEQMEGDAYRAWDVAMKHLVAIAGVHMAAIVLGTEGALWMLMALQGRASWIIALVVHAGAVMMTWWLVLQW